MRRDFSEQEPEGVFSELEEPEEEKLSWNEDEDDLSDIESFEVDTEKEGDENY